MQVSSVIPQLRTTDLDKTIRFYTETLAFALDFRFQDFYAGIRAGDQLLHLKRTDAPDPSIKYVKAGGHIHLYFSVDDVDAAAQVLQGKGVRLAREPHDTQWGTREFVMHDDQGHTLYFGARRT